MTDAEKVAALRRIVMGDMTRPRLINRLINIGLVHDARKPGDPFGPKIELTLAGHLMLEAAR